MKTLKYVRLYAVGKSLIKDDRADSTAPDFKVHQTDMHNFTCDRLQKLRYKHT